MISIIMMQARRAFVSAALTRDVPSSSGSSQAVSERAIRGPSQDTQQRTPKLAGKTVVISGGSQVLPLLFFAAPMHVHLGSLSMGVHTFL